MLTSDRAHRVFQLGDSNSALPLCGLRAQVVHGVSALVDRLQDLWRIPQIWFAVIVIVAGIFAGLALWLRSRASEGTQGGLILAAIWLIWFPLATGGELFLLTSIGGPFDVLPVLGSYLSFGAAFICARVAMGGPGGWLSLLAYLEALFLGAVSTLEGWLILRRWFEGWA